MMQREKMLPELVDAFGRRHTYLRVAVTDRCNLRCTYCMPPEGVVRKPHGDILTFHEIARVTRVLAGMGVDKVRLTGGEPLVRRDLPMLVKQLAALTGVKRVSMTTNGVLLARHVAALRAAGLASVNISLDTLQPARFARITLRSHYHRVRDGIDAALAAGFDAVKLNVVVIRGFNDDELHQFAALTEDQPLDVRFIEYMPFRDNQWAKERLVPYTEIRERLETHAPLLPVVPEDPAQPARDFVMPGHQGRVGIIASMTRPFCERCSRLRLTADGALKTCLFHCPERRLRDALRSGMSDAELALTIRAALREKPVGHAPLETLATLDNRIMTEIGG